MVALRGVRHDGTEWFGFGFLLRVTLNTVPYVWRPFLCSSGEVSLHVLAHLSVGSLVYPTLKFWWFCLCRDIIPVFLICYIFSQFFHLPFEFPYCALFLTMEKLLLKLLLFVLCSRLIGVLGGVCFCFCFYYSFIFFFSLDLFKVHSKIEGKGLRFPIHPLAPHVRRLAHRQHPPPEQHVSYKWWAYTDTSSSPKVRRLHWGDSWGCTFCGFGQMYKRHVSP